MKDPRVTKLAEQLITYSVELKPGEIIYLEIKGLHALNLGQELIVALDYLPAADDVARSWDEASLWYGAMKCVEALDRARTSLAAIDATKIPSLSFDWQSPWGWIRVRGTGDDRVDGTDALSKIATSPPGLIVTDLVMPEMDGLELLRIVRRLHPEIPVILITAYGDESTAVEALEAGAASYVPKVQKAERLMVTVDRVLERAEADRGTKRLAESMLEYHCRFALENDPARIVNFVESFVIEVRLTVIFLSFESRAVTLAVSSSFNF